MTETQPAPAGSGISADVAELDRALTRIAYLLTRNRRNGLTTTAAGVPLDRAAVTVLLELAGSGAMRPGELAARLEVEAPHVTRQVQRLERAGYAARGADPDDRRAQLIQLTSSPPCSTAWSTTSWPTTPSKDPRPADGQIGDHPDRMGSLQDNPPTLYVMSRSGPRSTSDAGGR